MESAGLATWLLFLPNPNFTSILTPLLSTPRHSRSYSLRCCTDSTHSTPGITSPRQHHVLYALNVAFSDANSSDLGRGELPRVSL
jgi:hypothetical protein